MKVFEFHFYSGVFMQENNKEEPKETPWGLIIMAAFFVLSLVGPIVFNMMNK